MSDLDQALLDHGIRCLPLFHTAEGVRKFTLSVSSLLESDDSQTKWALSASEKLADLAKEEG